MRIVYIFRSLAIVGGVERVIIDKMNYFSENLGYDISIITFEQDSNPIIFSLSNKIRHFDLGILLYKKYQYGLLRRILFTIYSSFKFRRRLKKQILEIDPQFLICTSYSLFEVREVLNLKTKALKIIETHSSRLFIGKYQLSMTDSLLKPAAIIYNKLLYRYIKRADAFITLTQEDAELWRDIKTPIVIPNMFLYYPEIDHCQKKKKQVISAGRLVDQKGYDLLISAWCIVSEKHPDWQLIIYGAGENYKALIAQIIRSHLSGVVIINSPVKDIYSKYLESEIFVLSSRWEGFGLVLVEAMSCGVPPVSFACPCGPRDIIADGVDGILVENGNIEMLAEKICFLIENDDVRKEMGRKARENVARFNMDIIGQQWDDLFKRLLKEKGN